MIMMAKLKAERCCESIFKQQLDPQISYVQPDTCPSQTLKFPGKSRWGPHLESRAEQKKALGLGTVGGMTFQDWSELGEGLAH